MARLGRLTDVAEKGEEEGGEGSLATRGSGEEPLPSESARGVRACATPAAPPKVARVRVRRVRVRVRVRV